MPLSVLLASIFIIYRNSLTRYLSTIPVTCLLHLLQVPYRLSTVIIKSYPHITPTSQHFSCGLFGIYTQDIVNIVLLIISVLHSYPHFYVV